MASGIASDWSKIALIDSENGRGELYSHLGPYNIIPLHEPYSPERYIEAIKACEDAGMEVIIIDSVTHEWDGKGGCLQINEELAAARFQGNTWAAWAKSSPRHQRFLDAITQSKCHIITTVRNKQDTIQTPDGKIKKVGLKEIQREGYEYELMLNLNLSREGNLATASKDNTELFNDMDPFKVTRETGEMLRLWANEGKDRPEPPKPPRMATDAQKQALRKYTVEHVEPDKQANAIRYINEKMLWGEAYQKMAALGLLMDEPTKEELAEAGIVPPEPKPAEEAGSTETAPSQGTPETAKPADGAVVEAPTVPSEQPTLPVS